MKTAIPLLAIFGFGALLFAQPIPQTSANPDQTGSAAATVQFSSGVYKVNKNESAGALIAVVRSGAADREVTVTYTSTPGTANPGSDYTPATGEVKFVAGETRKTFSVPIMETPGEGSTTVNLELGDPHNAVLGKPAKAVLSIMPASAFRTMTPVKTRVLKHLGVMLSIIGVLFLCGVGAWLVAWKQGKAWDRHLLPELTPPLAFAADSKITPAQQARMQAQLETVKGRAKHHRDVMAYFYAAYYVSIVTFSIAAALAGVTLLLVSQNGWQSANEYIVNIFFTSAAASAFLGSCPAIFEQQKNITDNKELLLRFLSLQNEVLSYGVTGEGLNYDWTSAAPENTKIGIAVEPNDFLHYVDLKLAQDNVAIGFDYQQVPNFRSALDTK